MKRLMVVLFVACGGSQLEPGEIACSSRQDPVLTVFGVKGAVTTHCEMGKAGRAPPAWWCTTRQSDNFGICSLEPGPCEWLRGQHAEFTVGCQPAQIAVCASGTCFPNAAACAMAERGFGRDGRGCVALRPGERVPPPPIIETEAHGRWCFDVRLERRCEEGRPRCELARRAAIDSGRPAEDCTRE